MSGWVPLSDPYVSRKPKTFQPCDIPPVSQHFSELLSKEFLRERVSKPSSSSSTQTRAPTRPRPKSPLSLPQKENPNDTSEPEVEKKHLWEEKYRPEALKDFICNRDQALYLHDIAKGEGCHHFIFEGPPGVGKRTMIQALLHEIFGPDKVQARDVRKTFYSKGKAATSITLNVKESCQHIEVRLSELKGYEKYVMVELLKETSNIMFNKTVTSNQQKNRAIVFYEADKLSNDELLYIREPLERYRGGTQIIFCCNSVSKLQPIMDLCNLVQLTAASNKEIIEVLEFIARKEAIELPRRLAERIADQSMNNLRQAIRSFEAIWRSTSLLEDQATITWWEDDIAHIAKSIVENQCPKQLFHIRRKLQTFIEHNISAALVSATLVDELKKNVDVQSHKQIDKMDCQYNDVHNDKMHHLLGIKRVQRKHDDPMKKIIQQYMGIEEFIARFMSYYKVQLAKRGQNSAAFLEQQL